MVDKKKTKKKEEQDGTGADDGGGVVNVRQVVCRPMSAQERKDRAGVPQDADKRYPDAPKPEPRNEYRPVLKQMRRKHKRPGQEPKPAFMSDVKV